MPEIKTVGVKELKNNLRAYLREVKRGTRILVAERDRVVAELHEPGATYTVAGENPLLERWIREGKVRLPTRGRTRPMERTEVHAPDGTAERLVDEARREGWEEGESS